MGTGGKGGEGKGQEGKGSWIRPCPAHHPYGQFRAGLKTYLFTQAYGMRTFIEFEERIILHYITSDYAYEAYFSCPAEYTVSTPCCPILNHTVVVLDQKDTPTNYLNVVVIYTGNHLFQGACLDIVNILLW